MLNGPPSPCTAQQKNRRYASTVVSSTVNSPTLALMRCSTGEVPFKGSISSPVAISA